MTTNDPTPRRRARTRLVALALVVVGAGGLAAASAATLEVTGSARDTVAAGSTDLTSCDTSVNATVSGYAWDATKQRFTAGSVVVSNIAGACSGKSLAVAVVDASGTIVAVGDTHVTGTSTTVPIGTLTNPTAAHDIHVVIS